MFDLGILIRSSINIVQVIGYKTMCFGNMICF